MEIVKRDFVLNGIVLMTCVIVVKTTIDGVQKFLFKSCEFLSLLGYGELPKTTLQSIHNEWKVLWNEIDQDDNNKSTSSTPVKWDGNPIFVTEAGLYALIVRSKSPHTVKLQKWMFEEVLPTLNRSSSKYELNEIQKKNFELEKKNLKLLNDILQDKLEYQQNIALMKDTFNSEIVRLKDNSVKDKSIMVVLKNEITILKQYARVSLLKVGLGGLLNDIDEPVDLNTMNVDPRELRDLMNNDLRDLHVDI